MQQFKLTPRVCRVRELSYSAPLLAHVEYYRGAQVVRRKGVCIGYIPVMVRSNICILHNKNDDEIQRLGECPLDPGGYFIVKGTEKVGCASQRLARASSFPIQTRSAMSGGDWGICCALASLQVLLMQEQLSKNRIIVEVRSEAARLSPASEVKSAVESSKRAPSSPFSFCFCSWTSNATSVRRSLRPRRRQRAARRWF